jgi:hypothetical protein
MHHDVLLISASSVPLFHTSVLNYVIPPVTSTIVIWTSGAILSLRVLELWKKEEKILGFLGVGLSGLLVVNCLCE